MHVSEDEPHQSLSRRGGRRGAWGMKQILLVMAVVIGQSVRAADKKPLTKEESAKVIEAAIRKAAGKPNSALTKADLEKVKVVRLTDKQLTDVKGLEKLTKLIALSFAHNQLTDVKGLEKLTKLRSLDLSNNKLTEVPKELEKCTQLTHLNLQVNQLTNVKGLEKLTQLTNLLLAANQLTNVKGLEKLNRLKKLHIYNNPALTKAQIAELQKALPKCRISSNPKN